MLRYPLIYISIFCSFIFGNFASDPKNLANVLKARFADAELAARRNILNKQQKLERTALYGNNRYKDAESLILFNKYTHYVIIPILSHFLFELKTSIDQKYDNLQLFKNILSVLSEQCRLITRNIKTISAINFSIPYFTTGGKGPISDTLSTNSSPAWDMQFRKKYEPQLLRILDNGENAKIESQFDKIAHYRVIPSRTQNKSTLEISCIHEEYSENACKYYNDLFWAFLKAPTLKIAGEFIYYMAHSTIFHSAQAIINEWLVSAALRANDLQIQLSYAWRNSFMDLDQIALLNLKLEQFIFQFMENVEFIKSQPLSITTEFQVLGENNENGPIIEATCDLNFICTFNLIIPEAAAIPIPLTVLQDLIPNHALEYRESQIRFQGTYFFYYPQNALEALLSSSVIEHNTYIMLYGPEIMWYVFLNIYRIRSLPDWRMVSIDLNLTNAYMGVEIIRVILNRIKALDPEILTNLIWENDGYLPYQEFFESVDGVVFFQNYLTENRIKYAKVHVKSKNYWDIPKIIGEYEVSTDKSGQFYELRRKGSANENIYELSWGPSDVDAKRDRQWFVTYNIHKLDQLAKISNPKEIQIKFSINPGNVANLQKICQVKPDYCWNVHLNSGLWHLHNFKGSERDFLLKLLNSRKVKELIIESPSGKKKDLVKAKNS